MQFFSTLALLAAVATAAVPEERAAGSAIPKIHFSKFNAQSIPHSVESVYGFTVKAESSTPKRAFKTKCSGTSNGAPGRLTPIFEGTCEDKSVNFSFRPVFDGLVFEVHHKYDGWTPNDYFNETGSYIFPVSHLDTKGTGNGKYQIITGPHAFKASHVQRTHVFIN